MARPVVGASVLVFFEYEARDCYTRLQPRRIECGENGHRYSVTLPGDLAGSGAKLSQQEANFARKLAGNVGFTALAITRTQVLAGHEAVLGVFARVPDMDAGNVAAFRTAPPGSSLEAVLAPEAPAVSHIQESVFDMGKAVLDLVKLASSASPFVVATVVTGDTMTQASPAVSTHLLPERVVVGSVRRVRVEEKEDEILPLPEWYPTDRIFMDKAQTLDVWLADETVPWFEFGHRIVGESTLLPHTEEGHPWARDYAPVPVRVEQARVTVENLASPSSGPLSYEAPSTPTLEYRHFAKVSLDILPNHAIGAFSSHVPSQTINYLHDVGSFMTDGKGTCYLGVPPWWFRSQVRLPKVWLPYESPDDLISQLGCKENIFLDGFEYTTFHLDEFVKLVDPKTVLLGDIVGFLGERVPNVFERDVLNGMVRTIEKARKRLTERGLEIVDVPMIVLFSEPLLQYKGPRPLSPINAVMLNHGGAYKKVIIPDYPKYYDLSTGTVLRVEVQHVPGGMRTIWARYQHLLEKRPFSRKSVEDAWNRALPPGWQIEFMQSQITSSAFNAGPHCAIANLPERLH